MNEAPIQKLQILLIDDHPVVRMGLSGLISCEIGCDCLGAADRDECLAVVRERKIDLAVLDVSLGSENGLDLVGWLSEQGVKTLVYSMNEDAETIHRALFEGCLAYVSKRDDADELIRGIRSVLDSEVFLSPIAAAVLAGEGNAVHRQLEGVLSPREIQTFAMLGRGYAKNEIAEKLSISVRTAETYFQRIIEKLELTSIKELRKLAIELRFQQLRG